MLPFAITGLVVLIACANVANLLLARGPDTDANTRMNEVGPGFFRVFSIPLLAGRDFTRADRLGAPKVAIVNEAFARKFGLEGDDPTAVAAAAAVLAVVALAAGWLPAWRAARVNPTAALRGD